MKDQTIEKGKTTAIIAYMTIVGSLIAISMNAEPKNGFARFHTRQAFGIHLIFHALAILVTSAFSKYAWYGIYIFYFVLWIYGFLGCLNNQYRLVPVLGPYFQRWFTFIG